MKFIKKFKREEEYTQFLEGEEYVEPHVVLIRENPTNEPLFKYKPKPKPISIFPYYISLDNKENLNSWIDDSDGFEIVYETYQIKVENVLFDTLRKALKQVGYDLGDGDINYCWELPENYIETHPIYINGERVIDCSTPNRSSSNIEDIIVFDLYFENDAVNLLPEGSNGFFGCMLRKDYLYIDLCYSFDEIPWSLNNRTIEE